MQEPAEPMDSNISSLPVHLATTVWRLSAIAISLRIANLIASQNVRFVQSIDEYLTLSNPSVAD